MFFEKKSDEFVSFLGKKSDELVSFWKKVRWIQFQNSVGTMKVYILYAGLDFFLNVFSEALFLPGFSAFFPGASKPEKQ